MSNYNWPEGEIETKLGKVHFARTQADHVSLSTEANQFIKVNGVSYHVHLHLHRHGMGAWAQKTGDRIYLQRDWSEKNGGKEPSFAARKAAEAELTRAWGEFEEQHPEQADEAERLKVAREIDKLEEEIKIAAGELVVKRAELKAKQSELKKIVGRQAG